MTPRCDVCNVLNTKETPVKKDGTGKFACPTHFIDQATAAKLGPSFQSSADVAALGVRLQGVEAQMGFVGGLDAKFNTLSNAVMALLAQQPKNATMVGHADVLNQAMSSATNTGDNTPPPGSPVTPSSPVVPAK